MNNNKNVWVFHHYATPPTMNGFTRPYDFGINLIKYGYNVKVFTASFLHFSDINLINDDRLYFINNDLKIPFVFVKTFSSSGNGFRRVLNIFSFYKNLFKVTEKLYRNGDEPDIIIASSPHPLSIVAGIKIAKKFKIPIVGEVRDFWPEVFFLGDKIKEKSILGKILLKCEHWIYKNSDALIFLKEGDYTYIVDKKWDILQGGDIDLKKCYYINNGVNIENFNYLIEKENFKDDDLDNEKFKVMYTGAIRPVNNIGNILDAAKILKKYSKIQFLIFGEGNQSEFINERIVNEKITNVKMKGYISKKYIPYVLSKSSVNILNYSQSKYNWSRGNSSNKMFEYMASGRPVISTVKMGYSLLEKYNCGMSVEEDTSKSLADTILKIYNMPRDKYLQMSRNAKNVASNFDYGELSKNLVTVLENNLL